MLARSDDFESQFAKKRQLETPFGSIETLDFKPSKATHHMPLLLAPGWNESLEIQKICLRELYMSGRRVIALRHVRAIKRPDNKTYPAVELQKAETLLEIIRDKEISSVDVVAHSEGAINVAIAANLAPQYFRHIVLVAPAGLSGKDRPIRIIIGFSLHLLKTRTRNIRHLLRLLKALKHPNHESKMTIRSRYQMFKQELAAMAAFDIYPLLMQARSHGIKVAVLLGDHDSAFPLKRVKRHLENSSQHNNAAHYGLDAYMVRHGGHELYTDNKLVMQSVFDLLNRLEP